jgi:glyceraldehyde-3-phosphate dehydrogenase (NADP+)
MPDHPDLFHLFPSAGDLPAAHRLDLPLDQRRWLVDGELRDWEGPVQPVVSPVWMREGGALAPTVLGSVPALSEGEALEALDAAVRAWDHGRGEWPTMPVEGRIRCVEEFLFRMGEKRAEVVTLLMWEIGKTLKDSEKEFDRTVEYLRDTIEALKELDRASSRFSIQQGILGQIRRAPLGVTLCMGPFNYPLNETFTTLIPALIMGNPVVFKPPKHGILLFGPLLEAFRSAFPKGVVNAVFGEGRTVVPPLMASGRVDAFAFIGTSRVANRLKQMHPKPHHLRSVLGLDAKNPAIVLPDADLDLAVSECLLGALSFNGQRCTALKVLFVHASIAERFLEKLCAAVDALTPGMPWTPGVAITPLPEEGKTEKLADFVDEAWGFGARVVNPGGARACASLFTPAVVYPVDRRSRLWSEEQFGPVVPIVPFSDLAEPLNYVVESNFGQQVSLFGNDPQTLARLIDPLVNQVCRVNLNSQCQRGPDAFPFTGRKDSAEGTLSVTDALRVFTIRTLVAAKATGPNKAILKEILEKSYSRFLSTDFIF